MPDKLEAPFTEVKPKKKKLTRRDRNDPIRKILETNKSIQRQKQGYNQRLLKILERIEYDRPILMQDKLGIIWGDEPLPDGSSPREKPVEADGNDSKLFN